MTNNESTISPRVADGLPELRSGAAAGPTSGVVIDGRRARPRLLMLAYDGPVNPATRLRALQFIPVLESAGFEVTTRFVPYDDSPQPGPTLGELFREIRRSDVVFVQRVLSWPLVAMLRIAGRPVVFDVDDAIHTIRQSQFAAALDPKTMRDRLVVLYRTLVRGGRFFSSRKRLMERMVGMASAVIVGNRTLQEWVGSRSTQATVLPTAVAVETFRLRRHEQRERVRIGWIGVPSNLFHLRLIEDSLAEINGRFGDRVELMIVSNRGLDDLPISTEFLQWSVDGESDAVLGFDIGIMPLQDDLFSRGKCSFKAIFCMAHGVPVVLHPVGMNSELVTDGVDGFLASTTEEWTRALSSLIESVELRARVGAEARRTIERGYAAGPIGAQLAAICVAVLAKST